MSFILFVVLLFIVTLLYVYITLGTSYIRSIEGMFMMMLSYGCWAYLDYKYILIGLIDYDFTRFSFILDVLG